MRAKPQPLTLQCRATICFHNACMIFEFWAALDRVIGSRSLPRPPSPPSPQLNVVHKRESNQTETQQCCKQKGDYLCPAVMVTFSAGRGTEDTLDAVKILVSESWKENGRSSHQMGSGVAQGSTGKQGGQQEQGGRSIDLHLHSSPQSPTLLSPSSTHLPEKARIWSKQVFPCLVG